MEEVLSPERDGNGKKEGEQSFADSLLPLSHSARPQKCCCCCSAEFCETSGRFGVYVCSSCGYEMFSSLAKYEHHTPWPAFKKPVHLDSLTKVPEEGRPNALKVSCGRCGNGLGHEFLKDRDDGGSRF